MRRTGLILTWLVGLFFIFIGSMNIIKPESVVKQTVESGFPESAMLPLGLVTVVCALLYLLPRTMVLGAALLTAYLGGAVQMHVLKGDALGMVLTPVVFGIAVWLGPMLSCQRLRAIFPLRT